MPDRYKVPAGFGEDTLTEKRSRFIGRVFPISSEEEAAAQIAEIRAKHRDAAHNVYAYRLLKGQIMRYSDDGEPQGTGGLPVLEVLRREDVQNVLCVVTRYFGGVLLGAGGLTRTYAKGAKIALDAAGIAVMCEITCFALTLPYDLFEPVKSFCAERDCQIESTEFSADVSLTLAIETDRMGLFEADLTQKTAGRIVPKVTGKVFRGKRL